MTLPKGRLVLWGALALALAAGLWFAFAPRAIEVDIATVERGPLVVTVAEEGETRIKDIFVVSSPLRGRALRIEIEEGDAVAAGETIVAEIEPIDPAFLDARSEAEARAAVETSRAALTLAEAKLTEASAELDFATAELARMRQLRDSNTISARALEDAQRLYKTREAAVSTAEAAVRMRQFDLEASEVRLLRPGEAIDRAGACPCVPIRAPVDGRVLRVLHESAGVVSAGEPLIEIGDPSKLEVMVDYLSSDAVRIEPGQRVMIDEWGGANLLGGVVRRVEPYGFTKVSALGIEEQRVNVAIDLTDPPATWSRLGHGFEVVARVVLWEGDAVVKIPLTALFRENGAWSVMAIEDGAATVRAVEIGRRTELEAEIIAGVIEGETVVRYPNDQIIDGTPVTARTAH